MQPTAIGIGQCARNMLSNICFDVMSVSSAALPGHFAVCCGYSAPCCTEINMSPDLQPTASGPQTAQLPAVQQLGLPGAGCSFHQAPEAGS